MIGLGIDPSLARSRAGTGFAIVEVAGSTVRLLRSAALRYAGDAEYVHLVETTLASNLPSIGVQAAVVEMQFLGARTKDHGAAWGRPGEATELRSIPAPLIALVWARAVWESALHRRGIKVIRAYPDEWRKRILRGYAPRLKRDALKAMAVDQARLLFGHTLTADVAEAALMAWAATAWEGWR